jgi:hypothetical protein
MSRDICPDAMSDLLEFHIRNLRLREDAPFPSEMNDAREFIRKYRLRNRLRVVQESTTFTERELINSMNDDDFDGDAA